MANVKISELSPLVTVQDADVLPIVDNAVTKKVTAAILRSYTQGNSVLLTGAQTVAGIKTFTAQLASSVATGTAPFSVASTTKVTNLNADLLDGLSSADFQATLGGTGIVKSTAGTISYLTDNTANWDAAYNDKINSAAVTGIGTNTLTLTQQDAGTITATWVNGTLIREIRNTTGATLTKGTIVYISGATGNKPTVTKAIATGDETSAQTFGFVQENILDNANGYVVIIGDLVGIDTSAYAEGDQLYLSSTTAGAFTDVKQYAPNHLVYVGIVTRAHPTLGQIEVNIQNGFEMDELHNVAAQNPSNGDILQYVTSTGLWTKIGGTTSAISEGSNLYFTNARSRNAISLTTTGTSGAATYNSTTGVLNVPNYADTDTGITSLNGLTALTQTFAVGTSGTDFGISSATSTHTFNLPTASAANRGALSSTDWTTFNNKTSNLGTVTSVGLTSATSGVTIGASPVTTSGDITLAIATASGSLNGLLSSTDWTTFNNKASTAALANYLPLAGGTLTGALGGTSAVFSSSVTAAQGTFKANNVFNQDGDGQITIRGASVPEKTLLIGFDTTSNYGYLQSIWQGNSSKPLVLQPWAANVLIGTTTDAGYKLNVNGDTLINNKIVSLSNTDTGGNSGFVSRFTSVNANSRSWKMTSDVYDYGDFVLEISTTQTGNTYSNVLRIDRNKAATFSSSVTTGGQVLVNTGTANQNTTISGSKVGMSRTSDGAEVVYFSKNTDLGAEGTANINGYDGIQFRTQGAESVKLTIASTGAATFSDSVTIGNKTTTQINALTPATGMVVFNTTLATLCFYDGSGWRKVTHSNM